MSRRAPHLSRRPLLAALLLGGAVVASLVSTESPPLDGVPASGPSAPRAAGDETAPARLDVAAPTREEAGGLRVVLRSNGDPDAPPIVPVRFRSADGGAAITAELPLDRPTSLAIEGGRYWVSAPSEAVGARLVWPDRIAIPDRVERAARSSDDDEVLHLTLFPPGEVRLRVTDGASPVDVPVAFRREGATTVRRTVRSGAGGSAVVRLPVGRYRVSLGGLRYSVDGDPGHRAFEERLDLGPEGADLELAVAPIRHPTLRVEAVLLVDGVPLEADRLRRFAVVWRGFRFRPAAVAASGTFVAEEVAPGGAPPPEGKAGVFLSGEGLREVALEVNDEAPEPDVFRFTLDVETRRDAFSIRYVGEGGRVLAREELQLVLLSGPDATVTEHRVVVTDAGGRADVEGVTFPCLFHVDDRTPGRRVDPCETSPRRVRHAEEVTVRRAERHRVVLGFPDPTLAEAVLRRAGSGVVLDVLPIDVPAERNRSVAADGLKGIQPEACESLAREGLLDLGDLAPGRYRVTLFVPDRGTWSEEVAVDVRTAVQRHEVRLPLADGPLEGTPNGLRFEREALVVDGRVPLTAIRSIYANASLADDLATRMPAAAWLGADGAFALRRHAATNDAITVLVDGARVLRFRKHDLRGPTLLSDDAVLVGRVVDRHGGPAEGLAVNLTSLCGGEGSGAATWPHSSELLDLRTDAAGRFEITGVTAGSYLLSVCTLEVGPSAGRNFEFAPEDLRVIEVAPGRQTVEVRLTDPAFCAEEHDCAGHGHGG